MEEVKIGLLEEEESTPMDVLGLSMSAPELHAAFEQSSEHLFQARNSHLDTAIGIPSVNPNIGIRGLSGLVSDLHGKFESGNALLQIGMLSLDDIRMSIDRTERWLKVELGTDKLTAINRDLYWSEDTRFKGASWAPGKLNISWEKVS